MIAHFFMLLPNVSAQRRRLVAVLCGGWLNEAAARRGGAGG